MHKHPNSIHTYFQSNTGGVYDIMYIHGVIRVHCRVSLNEKRELLNVITANTSIKHRTFGSIDQHTDRIRQLKMMYGLKCPVFY